jgi:hypothetical protein
MLAAQLPVASRPRVHGVGQVADSNGATRFRAAGADGTPLRCVAGCCSWIGTTGSVSARRGLRVHLHAGESWRLKVKLRAPRGWPIPGHGMERTLLAPHRGDRRTRTMPCA